jgi:acyl-CoA thioesterase
MFALNDLLASFDLKPTAEDRYTAPNVPIGHGVVHGGQILGQSIVAAALGQDGGDKKKLAKTVHTVFARAASTEADTEIVVDRYHAGGSMGSATVSFVQGGRVCARSNVLLTADEPDLIRHATTGRAVPGPDDCPQTQMAGDWEVRVVGGVDISDPEAVGPAELDVWVRFPGAPQDDLLNQALLAVSTDSFLIGTAMRPHAGVGQAQAHVTLTTGVLSHTLTFHEPAPAGDWLQLSHRSPYAGRGRTNGTADVFTADGRLVASFVQDAIVRAKASSGSKL